MPSATSHPACWTTSPRWWIPFVCSLPAFSAGGLHAQRQDEPVVETLAGILASEDARNYDGPLLRNAARHPDPAVRRHAALALGRIGNLAAGSTLLELLSDPDTSVQSDAAFALGLLHDPSAVPALRTFVLHAAPGSPDDARAEAMAAVARIGGPEAAQFLSELLGRAAATAGTGQVPLTVRRALGEVWRLGSDAPVAAMLPFATSPDPDARWPAVYSLARLRVSRAADVLLAATDDSVPGIRATAVRELTVAYADSAGIDRGALSARVRRLTADPDPFVRIAALRALGSYGTGDLAGPAVERVSDSDPNVRVQALATLGQLRGPEAVAALTERLDLGPFAMRRQALLSLARIAPDSALARAASWLGDADWRLRAAAAEALGVVGSDPALALLDTLTRATDGRVVAAALAALAARDSIRATAVARRLILHRDPVVRATAAAQLASAPDTADLAALVESYGRSLNDPIPDARIALVGALGRLAELTPAARAVVTAAMTARYPTCDDYLTRRAAATRFPALAARWGRPTPIATGRDLGDYRDIARRFVVPAERGGALPGITIDTDRGTVGITLFAADAPITVTAILRLADRGYFDGGTWHRVVPGFVAQDGDPRGDGSGGPGFALRDELNRHQYERGVVGMALDGPDTGGSQFFITLTPQPHLDGTYPVFGRVDSGGDVLAQVTQGDRIRRVRRR